MTPLLEIALAFLCICLGVAALAFAFEQFRSAQAWCNARDAREDDDDDDGGNGDAPVNNTPKSKPPTPFGIDPQRDPGDWWKHHDQ